MLTIEQQALLEAAHVARSRAYAPYSTFQVGAAVRSSAGQLFYGCNVENAAYPATVCAERVALLSAYAAGERSIDALAVVADTTEPVRPCGICRQVLIELAPQCTIMLANLRGDLLITSPQELLPGGFTKDALFSV